MKLCLVNVPLKPFSSYFIGSYLPGSIFDINTQCELIQGQGSIYCDVIIIDCSNFYQECFL